MEEPLLDRNNENNQELTEIITVSQRLEEPYPALNLTFCPFYTSEQELTVLRGLAQP